MQLKPTLKKILFALLVLIIWTCNSHANNAQISNIPSQFVGKWIAGSSPPGYILITKEDIEIEVNSNQIYISSYSKYDEDNPNLLLFEGTDRFGSRWDESVMGSLFTDCTYLLIGDQIKVQTSR